MHPQAGRRRQPSPRNRRPRPGLRWRVQQLHLDNNEGCAIADFNKDGKPDICSGEF